MNVVTQQEADDYLSTLLHDEMPEDGTPESLIKEVSQKLALYTDRDDWGGQSERTIYRDGGSMIAEVGIWPIVSIAGIWDDTDHLWGSSTLIDATDYFASQAEDGLIYFENFRTMQGSQNVKITYTGGYASEADVPELVKRAALIQIKYEVERHMPGKFNNLPGSYNAEAHDSYVGINLLPEVMMLMKNYTRKVFF